MAQRAIIITLCTTVALLITATKVETAPAQMFHDSVRLDTTQVRKLSDEPGLCTLRSALGRC